MLPLIILLLIRKSRKAKCVLIFSPMVILSGPQLPKLHAQERIIHYSVLHRGEKKGTLTLHQQVNAQQVRIKIESDVKSRFLILIHVKSDEEALFRDGILVYSSISRTVNGDLKMNQQLTAAGDSYRLSSEDGNPPLPDYPVHYSILSLYYREPVGISSLYSDNFRQYVPIKKIAAAKYEVDFPNGNYNYYSYKNGVCVQVDVHQSFYDLQFVIIN
jgi:hypothetical protein